MLSDLQSKDIITIIEGKIIGSIVDVHINNDGRVHEILVQKRRFWFFNSGVVAIKWNQIDKIGKDVILVNVEGG